MKLCVNIDHVATLREARGGMEPDPVHAAILCQLAGVDGITFHLREDRRHINERDVSLLKELINIKLNMEMANAKKIVKIADKIKPDQVTIVPERRKELTTEGGLDVIGNLVTLKKTINCFRGKDISVSLFINPDIKQIDAACNVNAECVELHTGEYANARSKKKIEEEFQKLKTAAIYANKSGLKVYAGHGLNYQNVTRLLEIPYLEELNIGHSIVSRSIFTGIKEAVKEMIATIK